jgi:hypothetical protein
MGIINGSVGRRSLNSSRDVRIVQNLLNKYFHGTELALNLDGVYGKKTGRAIYQFQKNIVGMQIPDSIVEPNGRTIRELNNPPSKLNGAVNLPSNINISPKNQYGLQPQGKDTAQVNRKERNKFVRASVIESAKTTRIIDKIMPHFLGVKALVISGFLNDAQRFWKINYHWEYIIWMIDYSLSLSIPERHKKTLLAIKARLRSCSPQPDCGYRTSSRVGYPVDKSPMRDMDQRVKILRQAKRDFKSVIVKANLVGLSSRSSKCFNLATAPVAHPGKSKHGTGYALDIEGDNAKIKAIAIRLGATVVFDERSHVHTEFKNM